MVKHRIFYQNFTRAKKNLHGRRPQRPRLIPCLSENENKIENKNVEVDSIYESCNKENNTIPVVEKFF